MSHIKGPRNLLAIGILIILVFFGLTSGPVTSSTASADAQRMISLYADGQKRIFGTDAHTVGQVLGRAGIKLGLHDLVEPAAGTPIGPGQFNINVYRAHPVLVQDGYQSHYATSAYDSARLIAKDAGLDLYPEDTLQTGVITNVVTDGAVGVKVVITRAWPFTVHADGKVLQLRTQARTVGAALAGAGVALGPQDTVVPAATAPLTRGLDITITRVSQAEATVTQTLPRPVQTISDPTLLKGKVVVQAAGSDGQKVLRYLIHYRDGVETSRDLLALVSQTDPTPRIEVVGTKVFFSGSVEYWRPLVEQAAAQWGLDPNMMLRIMSCESHGNATAVSRVSVGGQYATGLFQYLPSTWISAGGTADNILDGPTQIALTAKKMALHGTGAWACQ